MSYFNTSTNHPIIDNKQEYTVEKKYVSIHSEDRNLLKYPNPSDFEIELPQDYVNVSTVKLSTWSFPSNFDVFSDINQNNIMTFQFTRVYNPGAVTGLPLLIYQFLSTYKNVIDTTDFVVTIGNGFYDPCQMAHELTNQFNAAVTQYLSKQLIAYDTIHGTNRNAQFLQYANGIVAGGYRDFVIEYNAVEQRFWFGNRSSSFSLTQNLHVIYYQYSQRNCYVDPCCNPLNTSHPQNNNIYPDNVQPFPNGTPANLKSTQNSFPDPYINGLPGFLGLNACTLNSVDVTNPLSVPRFSYKNNCDVSGGCTCLSTQSGYWLTPNPDLSDAIVSYLPAPMKASLLGPSYFYLDIPGLNHLDETSAFNVSPYTITRNQTNSVVNSSFAKIGVTTSPTSQFYDTLLMDSYKYFNPPAERIRKLRIRLRYHNGQYVNFGNTPFSFTLEFTMFKPMILRNMLATKSYTSL